MSQNCDDSILTIGKYKFDISDLKGRKLEVVKGQYTYKASVCGKISGWCGSCYDYYSGCQDGDWDYCLGLTSSSDKFELIKGGKGLSITHEGGDTIGEGCWGPNKRKLKFEILCDKSKTGEPSSLEVIEPVCDPITYEYTFRFSHKSGCAIGGGGGLSGGSILLIIIFVTLAVYLIFGVIINIAVRKKSGAEIIPNSSFWAGLPSLIKDGMLFICGRRPGGYQTME